MATTAPDLNLEPDEGLYRRVIADPQTATRAERNFIRQLPPPEEEDRLCVAKTGLTHAELLAKAFSNPDSLTLEESLIVSHGVLHDAGAKLTFEERRERHRLRYREPSPLQELKNEAENKLNSARGDDEKNAVLNGCRRWLALDKLDKEERFRRWREHDAARRLRTGTPWVRKMLRGLDEDAAECWGFVIFRTGRYDGEEGETAWQRFREYFDKLAEASVLHWYSGPLLWPKFRAVFVEDKEELDGASNEQLRARFRKMREGENDDSGLPKGIRTTCFLVADREAIESEAARTPYVPRYADDVGSINILPEDPRCIFGPSIRTTMQNTKRRRRRKTWLASRAR